MQASAPKVIVDTAEMRADGMMFPDTPFSFTQTGGGRLVAFASGGSIRDIGPGADVVPFGTYMFAGTFDHLSPVTRDRNWPSPALEKGSVQASPDGSDFDRDYSGGGPTIATGTSTLLQIYHGEHRCEPSVGIPAMGGSGMAISHDGGKSFQKIGQILAPGVTRDDFCASGRHAGFWTDGGMIEGDADGGRPGAGDTYDYILFVDHNGPDEPFVGMSIARARKADVLAAVAAGKAPVFKKYFNPDHAPGPVGRFFTEPGIGGRSTAIVATEHIAIGEPTIAYDTALNAFVATYQESQKTIAVSTAANLLSWSPPAEVARLGAASDLKLFNPSPLGVDGNPNDLGKRFYIYYLQRRPRNTDPQLLRITIDIR